MINSLLSSILYTNKSQDQGWNSDYPSYENQPIPPNDNRQQQELFNRLFKKTKRAIHNQYHYENHSL